MGNIENNHRTDVFKKIAASALIGGVLFTGGCGENKQVDKNNLSSSIVTSSFSSRSESSSKVETIDKELALAPDLAGAKKVLQDNGMGSEVTYVAESGNQYGVEANKFLGVYRENVTLENEKVGGVALIPSVVNKLVNDKLNTLTDDQGKWTVFVPADISEIKDKDAKIDMEIVDSADKYKSAGTKFTSNVGFKISFDNQKVSISNQVLDGQTRGINNSLTTDAFTAPDSLRGIVGMNSTVDAPNQKNFTILGNFQFSKVMVGDLVPFGTKITETSDPIYGFFGSRTGSGTIEASRFLSVDKSPVFVIDQ